MAQSPRLPVLPTPLPWDRVSGQAAGGPPVCPHNELNKEDKGQREKTLRRAAGSDAASGARRAAVWATLCLGAGRGRGRRGPWGPAGRRVSRGGCAHVLVAGLRLRATLTTVPSRTSSQGAPRPAGGRFPEPREPSLSSGSRPRAPRAGQHGAQSPTREAGGARATRPSMAHSCRAPAVTVPAAPGPGRPPPCPQRRGPPCSPVSPRGWRSPRWWERSPCGCDGPLGSHL